VVRRTRIWLVGVSRVVATRTGTEKRCDGVMNERTISVEHQPQADGGPYLTENL
jgi:hypothetical protein